MLVRCIYIYLCLFLFVVMCLSVQNVRPLGVIAAGAWHSLPQIYVMYVLVDIVVDLHSRNPRGTLLYVACCHAEDLGYACCVPNLTAVVDVAVWMAWHAAVYATSTSGSLWPHCTLCYVIYVGADHAGPPHTQALGEWPLRHYQTFIPQ